MGVVEELVKGREAFERREWVGAYDQLSAIDPGQLSPDDVLRLGMAAYLSGDDDACVRALQQAYQAELDAGESLGAVRIAFWLGLVLLTGGDYAVGGGWVARAQRLLDDEEGDVVERGYLLTHQMHQHIGRGSFAEALELAPRIAEYGRQFKDADLIALGLSAQGRLMMHAGQVPEGLALLDEAMVGLTTSEVSPMIAGLVYCVMVEACQLVSDYARMVEWTSALTRWCQSQPDLVPFTAQCSVHRGQVLRIHGAFPAALEELDRAYRRYTEKGQPPAAGLALSERGDILRIRGAYVDAEAAYAQASTYGHDPQPGLALLWLVMDRPAAAAGAVRRLLQETGDPLSRSRLLPAAVEVLLAIGDPDGARSAMEEMAAISESFGCTALRAVSAYSAGSVHLAAGDAVLALQELRRSWQLWTGLDAPYEAARSRVMIGRVFGTMGDEQSAIAELTAARRTFTELDARPCLLEIDRLLPRKLPGGLTEREAEVLRLVAVGKSNPAIAADLVLSEKTVARHLSNIFGKIDVSSRTAAAAYAFEHHLT
ncbi:MAG: LuxR C-terminal-related transcriptional regulator [Lapillicoccus sp.]